MLRFMPNRSCKALAAATVCLLALTASASAQTRPLFSSQSQGSTGLTQYSIDLDTGVLTQQGSIVPSGSYPTVPTISPTGSNIYVGDFFNSVVHGFSIGAGGLTALAGSPYAGGLGPNSAVVSPAGNALWTVNATGSSVSGFSVDGAGALSEVAGSPYVSSGVSNAIAASPNNPFIFTSGYGSNTIAGFLRGSGPELTELADSPFADPGTPSDVEFSTAGNFLFVTNADGDNISSYAISPSGTLTGVTGSPFLAGDQPGALAASPNGKWLFALNIEDSTIQVFAISGDGALNPIGSPVATGSDPYDLNVSPDGRFLYTANFSSGTISGFAIDDSGALSELSGSPYGDASGAVVSIQIVPDQGPTASFASSVKDNTVSFNAAGSSDPDGSVSSYAWDFGDGTTQSGASPQVSHTYAASGNFNVTLRVTDNENCSNVQIGTGQSLACNGSARAVFSKTVSAIGPLTLKHATGRQLKSTKSKGKVQVRVQTEFFLNRAANVSYQFQKSSSKGRCRTSPKKKKGKAKYKNFGKKASYPGNAGRVRRTSAGKFGGKTIVPGRYRLKLMATSPTSVDTPTTTSASFCVR
jgi:6-phosphogluconolactonase (cycloisomerase 2 family)